VVSLSLNVALASLEVAAYEFVGESKERLVLFNG
jgi:hypothetical protein